MAVAEARHFGRAAQALGIPQPTVSRHVRDLEEALEVTLLVRTSRATTLTEAGTVVLDHARRLLDGQQRLRAAAEHAARQARGEVTVAFLASTVTVFLTPLLQRLSADRPEVELRVTQLLMSQVLEGLRGGTIDVAIARDPHAGDDVVTQTLLVEPMVAAVPVGHRLAGRSRIARVELRDEPMVLLEPRLWSPGMRSSLARAREEAGQPRVVRHAPSHASAVALVAAGVGVYPLAASAAVARDDVAYVEIEDASSAIVLLRRATPPTPPIAAVIDAALACAASAPAVTARAGRPRL